MKAPKVGFFHISTGIILLWLFENKKHRKDLRSYFKQVKNTNGFNIARIPNVLKHVGKLINCKTLTVSDFQTGKAAGSARWSVGPNRIDGKMDKVSSPFRNPLFLNSDMKRLSKTS